MKTLRNPIVHIANRATAQVDKPLCSVGIFNMENQEEWRPVVGYEGYYEVSNLGRVKSLLRIVVDKNGVTRKRRERILTGPIDHCGYRVVMLYKDRQTKMMKFHKLVAMAFLNHVPCGYSAVVDHIDRNPLNNNVGNLRITSQRQKASNRNFLKTSKYIGVSWNKKANAGMLKYILAAR